MQQPKVGDIVLVQGSPDDDGAEVIDGEEVVEATIFPAIVTKVHDVHPTTTDDGTSTFDIAVTVFTNHGTEEVDHIVLHRNEELAIAGLGKDDRGVVAYLRA